MKLETSGIQKFHDVKLEVEKQVGEYLLGFFDENNCQTSMTTAQLKS